MTAQQETISDNQFFYGTLYALAQLPNGKHYVDEICMVHGKARPDFIDEIEYSEKLMDELGFSPIAPIQYTMFFEHMYKYLRDGGAPEDPVFDMTTDGHYKASELKNGLSYMEIRPTCGWSNNSAFRHNDKNPRRAFFTPPLEYAVQKTGINRDIIEGVNSFITLQSDGQIIVAIGYDKLRNHSLDYPGKSDIKRPFFNCPPKSDLEKALKAHKVYTYRTAHPKMGQTVNSVYVAADGERVISEETAGDDTVVMINKSDIYDGDIRDPSLSDMFNATGKVRSTFVTHASKQVPGEYPLYSVEATDEPDIILHIEKPHYILDVDSPMQIGTGNMTQFAEPGDKIFITADDIMQISLVRKEVFEGGYFTLRPVKDSNAKAEPKTNKPKLR